MSSSDYQHIQELYDDENIASCIGCGCTDERACIDKISGTPCSWLRVDRTAGIGVCSCCPEDVRRWDDGDRTVILEKNEKQNGK